MKNYQEKEKKLNDALERLTSMVTRVSATNSDISELDVHKNQLISEKEEVEKKYQILLKEHNGLRQQFEKIKAEVKQKLENQSKLNEKIDELNQETEGLIGEIDKW